MKSFPAFACVAAIIGVVFATGCRSGQRGAVAYVSSQTLPAGDERAAEAVWQAVEESLRYRGFRLDRVDRRAGLLTTLPESSRHYVEFWRKDVCTSWDVLESTVNPIRRWVEVTWRGANAATDELTVIVHKERLSSPDRQFNSTIAAYRYFGESLPSTTGLVRVTPEYDEWLDMGRDAALEDQLLRDILCRSGSATITDDGPAEPAVEREAS